MEQYQNESTELFEHYRFVADTKQGPLRIDKFLVNKIEGISRSKIKSATEAGNIQVNGVSVKSNYKVKPNDIITVLMTFPPREIEIIPQDIPLNIVYEDDQLIVINKEAGLVVHPGYGNYEGTLVNALTYHFKDLPKFDSGEVRPGLVHRLDKLTTGIMVIAKTETALNKLAKQFYDRTINRRYIAIVWGNLKEDTGTITGSIGRNPKNRKKMHVFPDETQGKHAVTHYKVLERLGYVNIVECKLETGRTHQIRVHFEYYKHPLFNDHEYGGNKILRGTTFNKYKQFINNCFSILPRPALHAKELGFQHPVSDKYIHFDSDLPDDMKQVIEKWRSYTQNR
jgi:23S rRNA pseudouridine1911/1915/1917 synthase